MTGATIDRLLAGLAGVTWQSVVMIAVAVVLLYLAIARDYEPLLLVPIASGAILANLPLSPMIGEHGLLTILYDAGVANELFPILIFIGIGAMTDFGPLLENPRMILLGAAGQLGIFGVLIVALLLGFSRPEAASIGVIGAIDGPTSIYVSSLLRAPPPRPHHGRRVQLHGARAGDHAADHAAPHDARGAPDPNGADEPDDRPANAPPVPDRGDPPGRDPRPVRDPARGLAHARKPDARVTRWSPA